MENINNKPFWKFLIVWIGQLISTIGCGLTAFSLGVFVYQKTHTATSFALITLFSFLPSILLRPLGGVFADRFDRRLMMVIGDVGSASGLVFILFMMMTGHIELWHIYLGVTLSSLFIAIQSPAYKASVTDLLSEEQFAKASGLIQLSSSSQYLISPVLAGILLSITDIKTVLIIDISTFLIAILAVLVIKKTLRPSPINPQKTSSLLHSLKEGWEAITTKPGVLPLIGIISIITFFVGFLQTLLGPMILAFSDAKTLGTLQSISATGMLVSSLYIGLFSKTEKMVNILVTGLGFGGLFFALMGLTTHIFFITSAGFLFFCALPFINTSADVLIRKNIDNEKQGRAWGLIGVISQLGYIISYSLAGFLADQVFNPLFMPGGLLASTLGTILGTGQGRGIGFIFILSGSFVVLIAAITLRIKSIRVLANTN